MVGPDCASWGIPARSTSGRSFVNAFGSLHRDFVSRNNALVSRTLDCIIPYTDRFPENLRHSQPRCVQPRVVMLLLVILANHATFVIEQPRQSLLFRYSRFEWFANRVCRAASLQRGHSLCTVHLELHDVWPSPDHNIY